MALIEMTDHWVPNKMHGSIVLPDGADVEVTILMALLKLVAPHQMPTYVDIKYRLIRDIVTANENGPQDPIPHTETMIFFELD
jgi:hypothetical protein